MASACHAREAYPAFLARPPGRPAAAAAARTRLRATLHLHARARHVARSRTEGIFERSTAAGHGDHFARFRVGWGEDVVRAGTRDLPTIVVRQQVVMPAEQYSVGDVGSPMITLPVIDVVGFAPGGRPVAARPSAPSIARGEGKSLRSAEQSTFAP